MRSTLVHAQDEIIFNVICVDYYVVMYRMHSEADFCLVTYVKMHLEAEFHGHTYIWK